MAWNSYGSDWQSVAVAPLGSDGKGKAGEKHGKALIGIG